jgi:RNA polymerase sigma factor (sigma-70 family)
VDETGRAAFERLCRDEYPNVVRTAFLLTTDRQEALDVAQETFARAYQHWRTVSKLDRPAAWLQRVATNLAWSSLRRTRVRSRARPVAAVAVSSEPAVPDDRLMDALRSLSPAQRAAVVLRYYLDLSVEDSASLLRKRPGTVRALTSQALARLRELIPKETDVDG